jgi:hypothetical protein
MGLGAALGTALVLFHGGFAGEPGPLATGLRTVLAGRSGSFASGLRACWLVERGRS